MKSAIKLVIALFASAGIVTGFIFLMAFGWLGSMLAGRGDATSFTLLAFPEDRYQTRQPAIATNTANNQSLSVTMPAGNGRLLASNVVDRLKELEWQRVVATKNVSVDFYAMVVDQNSNPIPGVVVTMDLRHGEFSPTDGVYSTSPKSELSTDANGRIQWTAADATGDILTIESLTKEGYQLAPNLGALCYGAVSGNYENPVVIKMWKNGEKAQLISGSKFWGIIPDGRVYTIDLLQGTKAESVDAVGDLRVSIIRPAGVTRKDRYDWSFQIKPIAGGIIESEDDFMYEAPTSGYVPEYDLHLLASDPQWTYHPKKKFYIMTRGGQNYGRIDVEVFAHYQDAGVFSIDYAVNPNGSPNLQP